MKFWTINLCFAALIVIASGCKEEVLPPEGNLITNYSFEENGVYSTSGWTVNNTEYTTLVPENGGDFAIKVFQDTLPDEGYVEYEVTGLIGDKSIVFDCEANAFGGCVGTVSIIVESTGETKTVIATANVDQNTWTPKNLSANATFVDGDRLFVRMSAGGVLSPVETQFVVFDLATLEIN